MSASHEFGARLSASTARERDVRLQVGVATLLRDGRLLIELFNVPSELPLIILNELLLMQLSNDVYIA